MLSSDLAYKSEQIKKAIKRIPRGRIFLPRTLYANYPMKTAQRVLSQLIKSGEVCRLCRGMYFRPEKSRFFPDPVFPGSTEIVNAISKKTGEIIWDHGAVSLNRLGLSTQVPVRSIYYTTGRSRYIKITEKFRIKLVHVNPKKVIMPNTVTGTVVSALWFEGKRYFKPWVVKKIRNRIGEKHFAEVLRHIDKMVPWMRKVFLQYQNMHPNDPRLIEEKDEIV